jgi:hypothetical protein
MSKIPIDLRKVSKKDKDDLKSFWSRLSENDKRMVNLISSITVKEYQKDYYNSYERAK